MKKTIVVFKKFKGTVIALFPKDSNDYEKISSYEHCGQHSVAHKSLLNEENATKEEYKELKKELKYIGYDLVVLNDIFSNTSDFLKETIRLHRKPNESELSSGYGAIHFKYFLILDCLKENGKIKKWIKCPNDGERYYR